MAIQHVIKLLKILLFYNINKSLNLIKCIFSQSMCCSVIKGCILCSEHLVALRNVMVKLMNILLVYSTIINP